MADRKITVKPAFPTFGLFLGIFFLIFSIILFASPYRDWKMTIMAIFLLSASMTSFIIVDYSHMKLFYEGKTLRIKGFLSIRNLNLTLEDIQGYEISQHVDQINGLHDVVVLVLKNNKKILFSKIAYPDYESLSSLFKTEYNFLGYKPIKYGEFFGRWIPVMITISGILSFLVAIAKLLK